MICCLNSACHNPPNPDGTQFCLNCGIPLIVLRHYRPIRVVGSGGFGKTYLAEDVEKFNELCVIKQFAPQAQGTGAIQKATELFEQEARRLQLLGEHPQIPTLFAYFQEDNRLYLVQQFIDGDNLLDEFKQQGSFSEQKIRELLFDLLNILKTVHQQKVIHRDIKPPNIIRRQSDGNFVLIDFGASKQLTATVMPTGTMIGTFGYAPPEQMERGEAYPGTDLFSLGATCFHLLSGVNPWALFTKQGYAWVSSWRSHLKQSISQELEFIFDKLLQTDYQQRYQSAEAVLQDLNSLLQITEMPPTATYQSQPSPLLEKLEEMPPTATYHSQPSPPVEIPQISPLPETEHLQTSTRSPKNLLPNLLQENDKLKKTFLVGSAIVLLGLGGYGIWQISNHHPDKNVAYEKLALANSLIGHTDWVGSLAISPDGNTLVSGSGDRSIKIWNLQTNGLKTTLTLHTDAVTSVAITPDGQTLVSGSKDSTIKIWNLQNGSLKSTITGHKDAVNSLAISPDGQSLVSGSADRTIKIWDLRTGELKKTLNGHNKSVWRVLISPDGQTLVSGSYDNKIKVWNLQTGALKNTLTGHTDLVYSLAITPDGQTLVSGSVDKSIKIWNLQTGALKNTLNWHKYGVTSVAITQDGQTLISGSFDNTIKILNLQTGDLKNTLTGHTDLVLALAISPDKHTLVSASTDKTIKIWRIA
jgi:WD40 repeat protein/tRNA A-37 threonylcarbamoyl transferase component Bud32